MLNRFLPWRNQVWKITPCGHEVEIHGVNKRDFRGFVTEYMSYGIKVSDLEAFLKRWIDEEGEWFRMEYANGDVVEYPEQN